LFATIWIAMIVIARPWGDFPINDDWVYAAAVRSVLTTGRFEIYSFSSANVGPLVYWGALFAWLFGFSFDALRISGQVFGLVTVIAVYFLFVEVWRNRTIARMAALMLLVDPLFFALSNTFMTDVPFLGCVAMSLWAMAAGIRRERPGLVVAGLGIALLAVLLRQFVVIVLCGFAVAYVGWRGLRTRNVLIALAPLVASLLLNRWFSDWLVTSGRKPYPAGIPDLLVRMPPDGFRLIASTLFAALSYSGLLTIPLAILCLPAWRHLSRRRRIVLASVVGACAAVLLTVFVTRRLTVPIEGNVLAQFGIGPLTNGDTSLDGRNIPVPATGAQTAWAGVTLLSIAASAAVMTALALASLGLVRGWRGSLVPPHGPRSAPVVLGLLVAGSAGAYLAILVLISLGYQVFDRYMLPLALMAGLALPLIVGRDLRAWRPSTAQRSVASAFLVVAVTFSVIAVHDYFAWNQARWGGLQALLAEGVSPHRIDGGYEFNGWALYEPHYRQQASKSWWWVDDDEYQTASGPRPGYHVERVLPVARWWNNGARDLVILRRDRAGP